MFDELGVFPSLTGGEQDLFLFLCESQALFPPHHLHGSFCGLRCSFYMHALISTLLNTQGYFFSSPGFSALVSVHPEKQNQQEQSKTTGNNLE